VAGQINPFYFASGIRLKQSNAGIARILQTDLFFKINHPLALLGLMARGIPAPTWTRARQVQEQASPPHAGHRHGLSSCPLPAC